MRIESESHARNSDEATCSRGIPYFDTSETLTRKKQLQLQAIRILTNPRDAVFYDQADIVP